MNLLLVELQLHYDPEMPRRMQAYACVGRGEVQAAGVPFGALPAAHQRT
jgi:hypothetical protein